MDPVTSSIATLDNAIKALKLTMARIDDWRKVIPEGIALTNECNKFNDIIEDLLYKPDLPISDELESANTTIITSNKLIAEFINNDTREDRSAWNEIWWKIQRMILAHSHRATFKSTTVKLEKHREEFTKILKFTRIMDTPTAYWYKKSMVNEKCFKFWKDIAGQELNVNWTYFANIYQERFNRLGEEWNGDMMERIRRVACSSSEDTQLSISGFITLTNKCGFPLNYETLPKLLDSHAVVPAQTRMEVAKMINELITYYSTRDMRDILESIFEWYSGCSQVEKQVRANDWASTMVVIRKKPRSTWTDNEKLAEDVDFARRTYTFFYERYMVVFKIGQLSREMFAEVSFPGNARMHEFINNVAPLDEAIFKNVMGGTDEQWPSKKPKVYRFLEEYIEDKKNTKARLKKEKEEKKLKEYEELQRTQKRNIASGSGQSLDPMNAGNPMAIELTVAESALPIIDDIVAQDL